MWITTVLIAFSPKKEILHPPRKNFHPAAAAVPHLRFLCSRGFWVPDFHLVATVADEFGTASARHRHGIGTASARRVSGTANVQGQRKTPSPRGSD